MFDNAKKLYNTLVDRIGATAVKVLVGLAIVAVIVMPLIEFQQQAFWVRVVGYTGLFIILGLGLNIVVGFAGLLDLGYVAFYAIGAYTYGLLASGQFGIHLSFWLVLPIAALLAATAGVLLGYSGAAHARRLPGYRHSGLWRNHPYIVKQPARLYERVARCGGDR